MQNVISEIKATHFIEMIVGDSKKNYQTCSPISILDFALNLTHSISCLKTIAIFKIKLKNV